MIKQICPPESCTGCAACAAVCPQKCISLAADKQGHLIARIDQSKCINCGACVKLCPVNNPPAFNLPQACFAAWAKDEKEKLSSTSGGAASVLARAIIRDGGVVYGCACLSGCQVKHIRIDKEEEIALLKGSKYVYSFCGDVYAQIKRDLDGGRTVLFTGTSCQNAGIIKYFGDREKLFTVNLICHGVPSLQMLREAVFHKTGTLDIDKITFRDGTKYHLSICSGRRILADFEFAKARWKESYSEAFFRNISFRKSCYRCLYAKSERIGDLTLGDFWGLGKQIPFARDIKDGCSVILVNTERGRKLFEKAKEVMDCFPRELSEAVGANAQLRRPSRKNYNAKIFNFLYPKISFNQAVRLSCLDRILSYKIKKIFKAVK